MRRSADFTATVRHGARSGRETLVVHLVADGNGTVGFVVPRSVGGAVVRNRVKRRLRALVAARLDTLGRADMVVRALPASATASSARLAADLDGAVGTARRRGGVSS
ncbi:MAG: ribonuclease P protein component [Micrococcales bacterium]|nr:ribonuclease P protein component [Micrococcales bacterium]MCL2666290.1 ribonuclease P protein component [Micrococcales bacterium]